MFTVGAVAALRVIARAVRIRIAADLAVARFSVAIAAGTGAWIERQFCFLNSPLVRCDNSTASGR